MSASGGGGRNFQSSPPTAARCLREPTVWRLADRLRAARRRPGLGR